MKTDDLIGLLAADTAPVPRHAGERRFALALAAGASLLRTRVNSAWLVIGGALVGLLARRSLG